DEPLGIGSWAWRADDESSRRENRVTAAGRTPDLSRESSGEARPAGPPGSAPPWNENGDGPYSAALPRRSGADGLRASTRSRNILTEAWKEVARYKESNAISKATFILIHVEIHRRVEEAESIMTHPESGSTLCDLRSDAEMIWSTSSKGRTVMDFHQFHQAWSSIAKGLGVDADVPRYETFCSVALEACRKIGEDQQVNRPATRPGSDGLGSPSALPPDSPLRGSFPAGFDQAVSPDASGRWLLRSARPRENKQEDNREATDGRKPERGTEPEQSFFGGVNQQLPQQQQQQQRQLLSTPVTSATTARGLSAAAIGSCSPLPPQVSAAAAVAGFDSGDGRSVNSRPSAGDASSGSRGVVVMQRAESCRSWPPAWVKQRTSGGGGGDTGDGGEIILARGIFAASSSPSTATSGPQVKALDPRLLMGSVSQKALLLQDELRSDRARLLELQRRSCRGHATQVPHALCPFAPTSGSFSFKGPQSGSPRSTTAGDGDGATGNIDSDALRAHDNSDGHYPTHQHPLRQASAPRSVGAGTETLGTLVVPSPEPVSSCAVLGSRVSGGGGGGETAGTSSRAGAGGEWAAAADGTDSLEGSVEGSLSTGSLSTGTGKSRAATKAI
ncbi:unnamed protein product, partial [Pylaiella littoralis]